MPEERTGSGPAVFVGKGREAKIKVRAASITLGTGSICQLRVRDPVAAREHCRFRFDGRRFTVEDAGSATGTFLNGLQVAGAAPLEDGSEVVLGVTRITLSVGEEDGLPALTLNVRPRGFRFVEIGRKSPLEDKFRHDRDFWAYTEVGLGRFPGLRAGNWLAVLAALLAAPLLLLVRGIEGPLFEPGDLCRSHAQLFSGGTPALVPAAELAVAAEQGCRSCHDPLNGTPMSKCAQCHADMLAAQHPFSPVPIPRPDPGKASRSWREEDCVACHQEHLGEDARRGGFVPPLEETAAACDRCHGGTPLEAGGFLTQRPAVEIARRSRAVSAFSFGHDDHLQPRGGGAVLDCKVCHQRRPETDLEAAMLGGERAADRKDFQPVPFETCARCHVRGKQDQGLAAWHPVQPEHVWDVAWHGSDEAETTCKRCHEATFAPGLKLVGRLEVAAADFAAVKARYQLARRTHQPEFVKWGQDQACEACHRRGEALAGGQVAEAVFWHAAHLPALGAPSAAGRQELSKECLACHTDRRESLALKDTAGLGPYAWAPESCAAECHRQDDRPLLLQPAPASAAPGGPSVQAARRSDFPHKFHLDASRKGLEDGCFTCHYFEPPAASGPGFAWIPATRAEASTCAASNCHSLHANVGGGFCQRCHPMEPAGAYSDYFGKSPPPERPFPQRSWPEANNFSHFSAGHQDEPCRDCHGADGKDPNREVGRAATLAAVPIPDEGDAACRECHLQKRQRFHWR